MAITVNSKKEAWEIADRIFPTDYVKDEKGSQNAGYPIYTSTAQGVDAWISDLGTSLELNMANGVTVRIAVQEQKQAKKQYRVSFLLGDDIDMSYTADTISKAYDAIVRMARATDSDYLDLERVMSELVKMKSNVLSYKHGDFLIKVV